MGSGKKVPFLGNFLLVKKVRKGKKREDNSTSKVLKTMKVGN